jgi:hypothetical protein
MLPCKVGIRCVISQKEKIISYTDTENSPFRRSSSFSFLLYYGSVFIPLTAAKLNITSKNYVKMDRQRKIQSHCY